MTTNNVLDWEFYAALTYRLKVDGGYLYQNQHGDSEVAICFVPDVDLKRYQSHLRDAYTQGFKDGQSDAHSQYQKSGTLANI